MSPLVSVIIPTYNSANFIKEAIDSILNQTYKDLEIIIVNDGSTDNIDEVMDPMLKIDQRLKYLIKPNGGLGSARNFGINNSKGKYILPLDADDMFEESFILKAVQHFEDNEKLKVVYCDAEFFGAKTGTWSSPLYNRKKMLLTNLIFSCSMFKRHDFDRIGGYDKTMMYEDWDFWLRLLKDECEVYKIPEVLFYYRQHKEGSLMNRLNKKDKIHKKSLETIFLKNENEFFKFYGNPIEIELERQKFERILNKPIIKWVYRSRNNVFFKLIAKFLK